MKNGSSMVSSGFHGSCLPSVLLLFAIMSPLTATIHVAQNQSYSSTSTTCGSIQNQYNNTVNAGGRILIVTTVPTPCVSIDYNEIIVDILQPNTSRILSTAPVTNGVAVNTVTAPATAGPWNLTVRVSWLNYPVAGTLASYETTITIIVNGPSATSKVTSTTASSTKLTSSTRMSSTILSPTLSSVEVVNSTVLQYTVIVSTNATSTTLPPTVTVESTPTTSPTLSTTASSNPLLSMLSSTGAEIPVAVVVILAVAVFVWKRRR